MKFTDMRLTEEEKGSGEWRRGISVKAGKFRANRSFVKIQKNGRVRYVGISEPVGPWRESWAKAREDVRRAAGLPLRKEDDHGARV